jgi:hypothetical protein
LVSLIVSIFVNKWGKSIVLLFKIIGIKLSRGVVLFKKFGFNVEMVERFPVTIKVELQPEHKENFKSPMCWPKFEV